MKSFTKESCKLIHGDSLILLPKIPTDSFDATITSPPYNMNLRVSNGRYHSRQITKELSTKYENFDDNLPLDDLFEFNVRMIKECMRVSRLVFYNIQLLTGNRPAFLKILGHFAHEIKDIIIWDKVNGQPAIGKNILNSRYEMVVIFSKDRGWTRHIENAEFDRGTLDNVWSIRKQRSSTKTHGAVFPDELVNKLILEFGLKNVLDPMMGTGTTGVVSKRVNIPFVGIEQDHDYFKLAKDRLFELR